MLSFHAEFPFSVSNKAKDMYVQCKENTHNTLASKRPRLNYFVPYTFLHTSMQILLHNLYASKKVACTESTLPYGCYYTRRHACSIDIHYKQSMYMATANKSTRDVHFSNFLNSMPSGGFIRTVPLLTSSQLVLRTVPFDST